MLQAEEVRQRFVQIEKTIQQMSQACEKAGSGIPSDVKSSIQQLDQRSGKAKQELQQAQNDQAISKCVDELEMLGDKAKAACEKNGNVDAKVKQAVLEAHQALSQLKHQLH